MEIRELKPERRSFAVELSEEELGIVARALYFDSPSDPSLHEQNGTLFSAFDKFCTAHEIEYSISRK